MKFHYLHKSKISSKFIFVIINRVFVYIQLTFKYISLKYVTRVLSAEISNITFLYTSSHLSC